ncbi:MAG TPA: hypothetical protein VK743_03550 [Steroidobacteraceae bacterium]|jgi:hypothetical protein|nr:hypothetical protein [Steroidobacteraceae bacterium]
MAQTKKISSIGALAAAAAFTFILPSLAVSADTTSPFVGKWVLAIDKSTFDPPPAPKSETVTTTPATGGGYHVVIDSVDADGSKSHLEYTTANDGKSVPVTGNPNIDSLVSTQINSHKIKNVFMKAGQPVATGTVSISKSGKTMEGPLEGPDGNGGTWKYHDVFIRQ